MVVLAIFFINTANKDAEMFMSESGFDVEDILVDIFYWFDKSSKRKVQLEEFCSFYDQEYRKIIEHVTTRRLNLETAVTRSIRLYQSLRSYVLSQEVRPNRLERLEASVADPMTEVFFFFTNTLYKVLLVLINTFREKTINIKIT